MWRFIRVWLAVRTIQFQEDYIFINDPQSLKHYKDDGDPFIPIRQLTLHMATFDLWLAFLWKGARGSQKPALDGFIDESKIRKERIRQIDSMIRDALQRGYLETSKERQKEIMQEDDVRISPKGDDFATYVGGIEALLSAYPRTWILIAAGLSSPVWIPLLQSNILTPLCKIISLCHV